MARLRVQEIQPVQDMLEQGAEMLGEKICTSNLRSAPNLQQKIGVAQEEDNDFQSFKRKMLSKEGSDYREEENGMLYFHDRIYVPNEEDLRKQILEEAHKSRYAIHPGKVKMYKDMKRVYWWTGMKKDITRCVSTCMTCQKVKAEHKKFVGLLQP
jgi:hypothetical protein